MKTRVLQLTVMFLFLGTSMVFAQSKTEKIEVKGNCGMCETRIEKAATSVDGVTTADWDKENKILKLSFNETETSIEKIQKAIAKVGHDTPLHKASDEVYNALPACCKYDRSKEKEKKSHQTF